MDLLALTRALLASGILFLSASGSSAAPDTPLVCDSLYAPYDLVATDTVCGGVSLTWRDSSAEGTISYEIGRSPVGIDSVDTLPVTGPGTAYLDVTADLGLSYEYEVWGTAWCGVSGSSPPDTGIGIGLPPAPVDCAATDSLCPWVRVTWSASSESSASDTFVVFRDGVRVGAVATLPYSVVDSTAEANVPHLYEVRARSPCGYSAASSADSGTVFTAPAPPLSFTASDGMCGVILLQWQPPDSGGPAWGYRIVRGSPPVTTELPPDSLRYVDTPGSAEVVYTLRAYNCAESEGVVDTGRIAEAPPPPPDSCSIRPSDCDGFIVSWALVAEAADGYVIFRDDAVFVDSVGPETLHVEEGSLASGVDYLYRVFSVNDCGRSAEPCTVVARIPGPIAPLPADVCDASDDSCEGIYLHWNQEEPPEEVFWYKIRRLEPGGPVLLDSVGAETTSYLDATVAPGDSAVYAVQAGNDCHVSEEACTLAGSRLPVPSELENCAASENRCDRVTLTWYFPPGNIGENVTEFRIYRDSDSIASLRPALGDNEFDDLDVRPPNPYFYQIAVVNECGETFGNCQVSGSVLARKSPPALRAPADGASERDLPLSLRWGKRANVTGYSLEIALDGSFESVVLDTEVVDTSAVLSDLEYLTTYHWRVSSINPCGEGSFSPARTFTLGVAPGLELVGGTSRLFFGNGADSTFPDLSFVLENRSADSLRWWIAPLPEWLRFAPEGGFLAASESGSVTVGVAVDTCGVVLDTTLHVHVDTLRPGRHPIPLEARLEPPPRPSGDVDWDCVRGVDDAASVLHVLLGLFTPTAGESLGADANSDGRITIADLVFLGRALADRGEIPPPQGGARVDLSLTSSDRPRLKVSADLPIRFIRLRARVEGGGLEDITILDRATTFLSNERPEGEVSLFWFSREREGRESPEILAIRRRGDGDEPGLLPLRIELLDVAGTVLRPKLKDEILRPSPAPPRLVLEGVRPNPFHATTVIRLGIPRSGRVRLNVYDIRGSQVRRLLDETRPAGMHSITWDRSNDRGRPVASGVYFLQAEFAGESSTRRMTLLR